MTLKQNRKLIRDAQTLIGIRTPKVPPSHVPHTAIAENGGNDEGFKLASPQVAKALNDV